MISSFLLKQIFGNLVSFISFTFLVRNDILDAPWSFLFQIRNSVKLKRIMQTILSLGNALNQGTARGMLKQMYIDRSR